MGNSREYITELMKFCNPYSILVIGIEAQLIRLYCPFTVKVIIPVGDLGRGEVYLVDAVKVTMDLRDVYIINGKAYYMLYFKIVLQQ